MMYTPTTWKYGDIITEQKLNKLEQGLEDAGCKIAKISVAVTHVGTSTVCTPDKTFAEVMALIEDGYLPVYLFTDVLSNVTVHTVALPSLVNTNPNDPNYSIAIDVSDGAYIHNSNGMEKTSGDIT